MKSPEELVPLCRLRAQIEIIKDEVEKLERDLHEKKKLRMGLLKLLDQFEEKECRFCKGSGRKMKSPGEKRRGVCEECGGSGGAEVPLKEIQEVFAERDHRSRQPKKTHR